jgi:Uma2 family endonuclease
MRWVAPALAVYRSMRYVFLVLDLREIAPDTPRPIRRAEYERLVEEGFFEGERVELLYGVIVCMSPHGPKHDGALDRIAEILMRALGGRTRIRVQSGFAASDGSEPEPDIAVVPPGDYDDAHPAVAWLVVEVAGSSLAKDRGPKARLYAESGVEEYWIVNLVDGLIEVHTDPRGGLYRAIRRFSRGDVVTPGRFGDVRVAVSEVVRS